MQIRLDGDPILLQKALPVSLRADRSELNKKTSKMFVLMKSLKGIGLAANQVGLLERIIVLDTSDFDSQTPFTGAMINPEIIKKSDQKMKNPEGCLSFPGVQCNIYRNTLVEVKWLDLDLKQRYAKFVGITSICIQHEIDHLNGITMKDKEKEIV